MPSWVGATTVKTLLVMRHAKSDWTADFSADHDRPLNQRGTTAARHMGRLLAEKGLVPDLVMSSTAVRARATAELAIEAGGWPSPLMLVPEFYGTGPGKVLEHAAGAGEANTLLIVGHQPTWGGVVQWLTGERIEVKTATVAVVEVDLTDWSSLPSSRGRLTAVLHPR